MAHDREAEGGGMSPRDANIYDSRGVDYFHRIPIGGNSIVAHDRETEGGGGFPRDMNIYHCLEVD